MRARAVIALLLFALPLSADDKPIVVQHVAVNPNLINVTLRKNVPFKLFSIPPFNLKTFADKLDERLKGHCSGYQFVVSFNDAVFETRAGGVARQAPDSSPRAMSNDDKYNLASVSKTMTAIAAVKLLDAGSIDLDTPMFTFLPKSFMPGPNVKTITFRELLTHRSGIRCGGSEDRAGLESCIANGIKLADKKEFSYNNRNFSLFRFLIPELEDIPGRSGRLINKPTPAFQLDYSRRYMAYVQKNVFDPAGLPRIFCKPTDAAPALCYQYPCPPGNGDDFGDMTETNASRGWTMSSKQLAAVFRTFLYTEKTLPATLRDRMKNEGLGLYQADLGGGVIAYNHGGYYPGKDDKGNVFNLGELNSLIWGTSNGVSVALIVSSQYYHPTYAHNIGVLVNETAKEMMK